MLKLNVMYYILYIIVFIFYINIYVNIYFNKIFNRTNRSSFFFSFSIFVSLFFFSSLLFELIICRRKTSCIVKSCHALKLWSYISISRVARGIWNAHEARTRAIHQIQRWRRLLSLHFIVVGLPISELQ